MMNLARHGNQLLSEKEPWKTIKTDKDLTAATLYDGLQIIANLAILCEPFLPFTSKKICDMLQLDGSSLTWNDAARVDLLTTGHQLGTASLLYQKIEDGPITTQIEKLQATTEKQNADNAAAKKEAAMTEQKNAEASASKGEITFDDFAKIDLRVGTILTAEKVEKADKLLKLTVDMGYEVRTIVSGIAEHFKPEDIIGLQVSVVANLAPRKLRGIESKGMILLAEDESGKLVFVTPKEAVNNGSIVK
jgi:methionyl-tRNA synthetase